MNKIVEKYKVIIIKSIKNFFNNNKTWIYYLIIIEFITNYKNR